MNDMNDYNNPNRGVKNFRRNSEKKVLKRILLPVVVIGTGVTFAFSFMKKDNEDNSGEFTDTPVLISTYENETTSVTMTENIMESIYWVIFEEGYRDNRIEMSKVNVPSDAKIIFDGERLRVDQDATCYQYYYDNKANNWIEIGTYDVMTDFAHSILASNVNIYDEDGNVVFMKNCDAYTEFDVYLSESSVPETSNVTVAPRISDFSGSLKEVYATSQLATQTYGDKTYVYSPQKAVDNDFSTCWSEGADGNGNGESITLSFDKVYEINEIRILNGLCASEDLFYKNSRLREISIAFSDGQSIDFECNDGWNNRENIIVLPTAVETSSIIITIKSVYEGEKYKDTCVSEISVS